MFTLCPALAFGFRWASFAACLSLGLHLATGAHGASVSFTDGTFNDGEWTTSDFGVGAYAFDAVQITSGGNPDDFRQVDHDFLGGSVNMRLIHAWDGATYDPGTQGAINSLDFSIDYMNIDIFGAGHAFGVALVQDGKFFRGSSESTGAGAAGWNSHSEPGRQQDDFGQVLANSSIDGSVNPDFSSAGSIITFGFTTANSTGSTDSIDVGYDNWSVTLDIVPEPSALLLFLAGAPAVLGLRRVAGPRLGVGM